MTFMFNPYPYEDDRAVNRPTLSREVTDPIIWGTEAVIEFISRLPSQRGSASWSDAYAIAIDGYMGIEWEDIIPRLAASLASQGCTVSLDNMADYYKSAPELEEVLAENLPINEEQDPVSLFGKLFEGSITDLCDPPRVERLLGKLRDLKTRRSESHTTSDVHLVYGCGAASEKLVGLYDVVIYCDLASLHVVQRVLAQKLRNLGDDHVRSRRDVFRRLYYVDYEVTGRLRESILKADRADYYVDCNDRGVWKLIPRRAFNALCKTLAQYPLRCKPCYTEGVWGGYFIKRLRELPKEMKNCAWVFDLIPNEVSLLVQIGDKRLEIPFATLFRKEGEAIMGAECVKRFQGAFPVRVNYDDTYHSAGNMSIQVHPTREYNRKYFGEPWQQDESYYVVATGHESKTYLGLKDEANVEAFFAEARRSEREGTPVEYDTYINSIASKPGDQFLIPAGTVHASGRNQVVLEIGSLTVGSYTFKLYDYLRLDLDGKPRPIHSWHGRNVLQRDRSADWVSRNIYREPRVVRKGGGWAEYAIGEHKLMYFSHRRLEFEREIGDDTEGQFHILVLVDGEKILVQSASDPGRCYEQKFLDVVLVPAAMGKYVLRNLGNQPIRVHKTVLTRHM